MSTHTNAPFDTIAIPAQRLGQTGIVVLLALLSAFVPLATDLYLPALPQMSKALHTTPAFVSMTLSLYLVAFSVGTLFWGALSDKYGRRPMLLAGLVLFTATSLLCALAANIGQLVAFRLLNGLAGGAAPAIATVLVKDLFQGRKRMTTMAVVQSMVIVAPIVAPVVGAFIIDCFSWRGCFWALALTGAVGFCYSLALRETVTQRSEHSIARTFGQLVVVYRNPKFARLLWIFSAAVIPVFAFIGSSAYIYIDEFKLTKVQYSLYFISCSGWGLVAPLIYIAISRRLSTKAIIDGCMAVMLASGLLVCFVGRLYPWAFALSFMPTMVAFSLMRPPSTNLMLDQEHSASGSAAALINCLAMVLGSVGMQLMSLPWRSMVLGLGGLEVVVCAACLLMWKAPSTRAHVEAAAEAT